MTNEKKAFINKVKGLPIYRQCELLGTSESSYYRKDTPCRSVRLKEYHDAREAIREIHSAFPAYGARRLSHLLNQNDIFVGRKLTRDLMKDMGIHAIYPLPNVSAGDPTHKKYSYFNVIKL